MKHSACKKKISREIKEKQKRSKNKILNPEESLKILGVDEYLYNDINNPICGTKQTNPRHNCKFYWHCFPKTGSNQGSRPLQIFRLGSPPKSDIRRGSVSQEAIKCLRAYRCPRLFTSAAGKLGSWLRLKRPLGLLSKPLR